MVDALKSNDIQELRRIAAEALTRVDQLQKEKSVEREGRVVAEAKLKEIKRENEALLAQISNLVCKLAKAQNRSEQKELEKQLVLLRAALKENKDDTYGPSSERRPRDKEDSKKGDSSKKNKKPGHGPTQQLKLTKTEVTHEFPEGSCCDKCRGKLRKFGENFEESELIISVKRVFYLEKNKRRKGTCADCGHIQTAPGPLKLIKGGRYGLSFCVQIALDKYLDALPTARQVARMRRLGLQVTSQTLWDQLFAMYLVLFPTYLALHNKVLGEELVHVDETPWRMMGKGRSKKWWLWTVASAAGVYYHLSPSRSSGAAREILKDYSGIVMADFYTVYRSLEKGLERHGPPLQFDEGVLLMPNYELVGCWMHARRPFFKSLKTVPEVSEVLDLIGELYAIEDEAKELARGDPKMLLEHRRRLREDRSKGVIEKIKVWRDDQRALPKTKYGKGVQQLKDRWDVLTRFLSNPLIPLDNGEAERKIRGPAVGRKNYYGVRSERGARVTSLFFSLIYTCIQLEVDAFEYLLEALRRGLKNPGTSFLPHEYKSEILQTENG